VDAAAPQSRQSCPRFPGRPPAQTPVHGTALGPKQWPQYSGDAAHLSGNVGRLPLAQRRLIRRDRQVVYTQLAAESCIAITGVWHLLLHWAGWIFRKTKQYPPKSISAPNSWPPACLDSSTVPASCGHDNVGRPSTFRTKRPRPVWKRVHRERSRDGADIPEQSSLLLGLVLRGPKAAKMELVTFHKGALFRCDRAYSLEPLRPQACSGRVGTGSN